MKALKIKYNNKKYILGVENGITTFSIVIKNKTNLQEAWAQFGSLQNNIKFKYFEDFVKKGDMFSLEIMDDIHEEEISSPIEIINTEESTKELVLNSKLQSYYRLKKELEENGMI
jgi:antitoxin component YwqK of YwqJK toxin-antitoxin module